MSIKEHCKNVLAELCLLDNDRLSLKNNRGFSDEVIDILQFKSSGRYLEQNPYINTLPQDIRDTLLQNNIIIPYLDPTGLVYHMRPHKFGFKDSGVAVYVPYPLLENLNVDTLVLAESEFKAVASCIMGVAAIGIPGIASFARKHLPTLIEIIKGIGPKKVVICFDNEVKDNPEFSNYKADYTKRYDTMIYEYIMASSIKSFAYVETFIAKLKDDWRVNGKIDIDGVLSSGISHNEYQDCINLALPAWEYKAKWDIPTVHRSYIERRIDAFFYKGPVEEQYLCYYDNSKEAKRKLTNFTINIAYTLSGSEGVERFCRLESHYGNSSSAIIKPEIMASKMAFQKFCYEMGDYQFYGKEEDLGNIWNYLFLNQSGRIVQKLKGYGYDASSGVWFFDNGGYCNDNFYPADDDGIVWVEDSGYMLPAKTEFDPPVLNDNESFPLTEIYEKFSLVIDKNFASIIMGWIVGNFFLPEILKEFNSFPFLFLYGRQQAGKSTIANWASSFFGFSQKGIPFWNSSVAGMTRVVSQMSMVPVWLEEYRNKDPLIASKNNFLRSVYDKSTIVKGTKNADEIKTYTARSTLIISGEEHSNDSALNSRCFLIPVFKPEQQKSDAFNWIQTNMGTFNGFGHKALTNKKTYWPMIKTRAYEYLEAFDDLKDEVDRRSKIHMSVIAALHDIFIGQTNQFTDFVGSWTKMKTDQTNKAQALNVFFEDIMNLWGTGCIDYKFITKTKESVVYIWFSGIYSSWENAYRNLRNDIPASKTALIEHISREPYYLGQKNHRIDGKVFSCLALNGVNSKFPASLKSLLRAIEDSESSPFNLLPKYGDDNE